MQSATATQSVSLSVPIDTRNAAGDGHVVSSLVLRRPKTKHVKKLVALLGPEFVTAIFGDGSMSVSSEQIVTAIAGLVTADRLDGLTEIVADLCGVEQTVIDELDPDDLPAVIGALTGFFSGTPVARVFEFLSDLSAVYRWSPDAADEIDWLELLAWRAELPRVIRAMNGM